MQIQQAELESGFGVSGSERLHQSKLSSFIYPKKLVGISHRSSLQHLAQCMLLIVFQMVDKTIESQRNFWNPDPALCAVPTQEQS